MSRRPLRIAALAATAAFIGLALPGAADHSYTEGGRVVAFDHRTGNEWWVEAVVTGQDAGQLTGVEAQDEGGAWTALQLKSWGAWAASFHIEPGNDVRFRATWAGGAQTVSCWFTHPAGVEQCAPASSTSATGTSTTSPPTSSSSTSSSTAAMTFDHRTGNEWWLEATVAGTPPMRVDAQREGGAWTPLQQKSWGAWAASFHIPSGHDVRFRADAGQGWQESCWFTHPQGLTPTGGQTCPAMEPSPPPATVTSTTTASPAPTSSPSSSSSASTAPPAGFDASFSAVKGNPWWVETRVTGNRAIQSVEARVEDGAWRPLTLRDWGSWAASFHVPDGSYLDFRAIATDGAADGSGDYVWPTARPVGAWPTQGSFVSYRLHTSGGAPDGSFNQATDATLRLVFDGASWQGRCIGTTTTTDHTGAQQTASFDVTANGAPAHGPMELQAGQEFDPVLFEEASYGDPCRQDIDRLVAETHGRHQTSLRDSPGGRQVTLASWMTGEPADASPYRADTLVLDSRLGLALDWSNAGRGGGFDGHLVDTDAPIR